jgi:hypothetical protein
MPIMDFILFPFRGMAEEGDECSFFKNEKDQLLMPQGILESQRKKLYGKQ